MEKGNISRNDSSLEIQMDGKEKETEQSSLRISEPSQNRTRTATSKGREFELTRLKENRKVALANVTKQINKIRPLLLSNQNESLVRTESGQLDQLTSKLQEMHDLYVTALNDENEIASANEWFYSHDLEIFQFKESIIEFLNEVKKLSPKSFRSHSSNRSGSFRSSSSVMEKLLEAKTRAASLEVKAAFLKKKQALRAAEEELNIQQELEQAKIETVIYEQCVAELPCTETNSSPNIITSTSHVNTPLILPTSSYSLSTSTANATSTSPVVVSASGYVLPPHQSSVNLPVPQVTDSSTAPYAQQFLGRFAQSSYPYASSVSYCIPTTNDPLNGFSPVPPTTGAGMHISSTTPVVKQTLSEFADVQRKQAEISEMILAQQVRSLLPAHKPPMFSGDVMEYPAFVTAFETLIESKVESPIERLYFLGQYTNGKAKELIKGCLQTKTVGSYDEARKLLKKHFGDPFKIANAHVNKISSWPIIKTNDAKGLQEFSITLEQTRSAMSSGSHMSELNTAHVLRQLWEKLPRYLRNKWTERASKIKQASQRMPNFEEFCSFVSQQADLATDPVFSEDNSERPKEDRSKDRRSVRDGKGSCFAENVRRRDTEAGTKTIVCILCGRMHNLNECYEFLQKSLASRRDLVKERRLCYSCLGPDHVSRSCKVRQTCTKCKRKHPTSLHDDNFKGNVNEDKSASTSKQRESERRVSAQATVCNITEAGDLPISMGVVPVWLHHNNNPAHKVKVYALLDNGSGGTFVSEECMNELNVEGSETKLLLTTMHGTQEVRTKVVEGLVVTHFQDSVSQNLPRVYARQNIPVDRKEIPRPEMAQKWTHLQRLTSLIPPYMEDIKIGLLIGLNCPNVLRPRDVIYGKENEPYAVNSLLGWYINGPVEHGAADKLSCNRVHVTSPIRVDTPQAYIIPTRSVKECMTPQLVQRMFELDFSEREDGVALSREDQKFLNIARNGICHLEDLHYELPLPFKREDVQLPYNRCQAMQRLNGLKKRLETDSKYRRDYEEFMSDVIAKGYAKEVNEDQPIPQEGKVWYIPHHGVYHPKKPDRIRVVFDCSAKYQGQSLNGQLLQGPDLTNKLSGVLTRFREENYAFIADIEKMFYQVKVKEDDQNFLRFLWWPNADTAKEPVDYQMTVHLFGAVSSPGCANFALKTAAEQGEEEFGSEAATTVKNSFYVDDLLKSVGTEDKAIELINNVKGICAKGGFKLTKFVSNSRKVIDTVPEIDRTKELKGLDLGQDKLPIERALGVQWCVESDVFNFRIELKDRPCTRRGILSTISSIYDPLGFIAPVVLSGKKILQRLSQSASWDMPISDETFAQWERWRSQLFLLQQVNVPRCFKPPKFGKVVSAQLHSMSDASEIGMGQCSYLRLVNEDGKIHCAFVAGKSRVTPRKAVSIPRLELAAATISAKAAAVLKKELEYKDIEEFYWTDSKVTIGFINNESRRFRTYVANRVQTIREHTSPSQWKYVESGLNPADEGSRGLTVQQFVKRSMWLKGPDFLRQKEEQWPVQDKNAGELETSNPELKKIKVHATNVQEQENLLARLARFSDWQRLKAAVAKCLKLKQWLRDKIRTAKAGPFPPITVQDLEQAETEVIKLVQSDAFSAEINVLKNIRGTENELDKQRQLDKKKKTSLKKISSLHSLDPFLDTNGVLRVGGRIKKADLGEGLKTPIILPKVGHVTQLVVRFCHEKTQHSGRGMTLNELRSRGFWVIGGNTAVRRYISMCVRCRYLRGPVGEQKMADLPESRLQSAPPFTYCGVDYFGPWYVKQGRSEVKRYGALFTCMSSRAIHIEIANSLDADSFIQATRRFLCRRGPIRELRSDPGTNFIGAQNELKKAVEEMDKGRIREELLKENIDWVMNPAKASNYGGVWERQIRSVRGVMTALLKEHGRNLNDESLHTFMCEAEAIINSRPLTVDTISDPLSPLPLSPSTLLTGKTKLVLPPPGKFQNQDVYCRRRWRCIQHIANQFWNRWSKEYLQNLQARQKWTQQRRNLTVGDIVLMRDNNTPRNKWPMAKVVTTYPDDQGHVRSVTVVTSCGSALERPINKLVLLLESPAGRPGIPDREPKD